MDAVLFFLNKDHPFTSQKQFAKGDFIDLVSNPNKKCVEEVSIQVLSHCLITNDE